MFLRGRASTQRLQFLLEKFPDCIRVVLQIGSNDLGDKDAEGEEEKDNDDDD